MQKLIDPDGANQFIARFEWVNDKVCGEEDGCGKDGGVSKEDKDSSIGSTVVEIDFPTFAFLNTHPGTLKSKITDKMAGQPDK